jgi:acyl transferase domain-containing protein/phosphopantetheinyl transferase (holo-ACP synthase)
VIYPEPIAIVGMACAFPGAPDLAAFWRLIANGQSALCDVPPSRLEPEKYGLQTRRGGFLEEPMFDPLPLGIMPTALEDGDAEQFLLLSIAHAALCDAGLDSLREQGERAEIVVGRGGYMNDAGEVLYMSGEGVAQIVDLLHGIAPELSTDQLENLRERLIAALPQLSSEAVACAIPNLVASRVANRLDCGGASYLVDGACASSLLALDHVVRDLRSGRCDLGLAAGIHLTQKPYFWRAFEELGGVSKREKYAPFDAASDGLVMGEGVGVLVLKRWADAVKNGDRVYALVRAVGVSSDGRGQGLMAPRREGQVLALQRAYQEAQLDPSTVSLIEAHGTGTVVGDAVELDSLHEYFGKEGEGYPTVALGTVKSQIGHAMPAGGMAGIIKAALAIHQSVLPPTINVEKPHPKLQDSRFYLNSKLRPWLPLVQDNATLPLRAGVNAFGFGGINAHAILEAAPLDDSMGAAQLALTPRDHELFVLAADSKAALAARVRDWQGKLADAGFDKHDNALRDVAYTAWRETAASEGKVTARLAIVASTFDDLKTQLAVVATQLDDANATGSEAGTVYFREGECVPGKLAVLFPGIGFPGLAGGYGARLAELCLHFPVVRDTISQANVACKDDGNFVYPLEHQLFPPPFQSRARLSQIERELGWSSRTSPGMMAANMATWELLRLLQVEPDALAGFSLGEWSALTAAGVVTSQELLILMQSLAEDESDEARFNFQRGEEAGIWAMIAASPESVEEELRSIPGVINITIDTAPHQVFVGGEVAAVREAITRFKSRHIWAQELPFPAVHTPLAAEAVRRLTARKEELPMHPARFAVYCGAGGTPYPQAPDEVLDTLFGSICEPVRVRQTVTRLYEDGVRIFVQVGSGGKMLSNLRHAFGDQPYEAVAMDLDHRGGLEQFLHCAAQLFVCGVSVNLDELFARRDCREASVSINSVSPTARVLSLTPPRLHADENNLEAMRSLLVPSTPAPVNPAPHTALNNGAHDAPDAASVMSPMANPIADVMRTMEQFLAVQQQHEAAETLVLSQYLQTQSALFSYSPQPSTAAVSSTPITATPWPLLGEVIQHEAGRSLTTRLVLDLQMHPLLQDHCLLRIPEELKSLKPPQELLPTVPMTASLEILCEAATVLAPGWEIVALHDVEAHRWIALESALQQPVQIQAQCVCADSAEVEVAVEIRVEKNGKCGDTPALSGRVTLRHNFPSPPAPLQVRLDRACPRTASEYYHNGPLFHGQRFHVIRELCTMSDEGIEALLEVPDPQALFAAPLQTQPILDAALLDGLGQVLGYPTAFENWAVFPQKLGRLERYAATPPVGSRVRCLVRYRRLDARRLIGDVDVFDESGNLWLRISNWLDWRVLWPKELLTFDYDPRKPFLSSSHEFPVGHEISCRTVSLASLGGVDPEWYARLYLRPDEWRQYLAGARLDWLLGRIAAKDAVREYLLRTRDLLLHPLEIELANQANGKPIVILPSYGIEVSIAHLADEALAAVSSTPLGVDLARLEPRAPEWKDLAFHADELQVLGASEEWLLRAWCAKEAAAKARGLGLEAIPHFRVVHLEVESGATEIRFTPEGSSVRVQTQWNKNRALAVCVLG